MTNVLQFPGKQRKAIKNRHSVAPDIQPSLTLRIKQEKTIFEAKEQHVALRH